MKTEIWLSFKYLYKNKETQLSFVGFVSVLGICIGVASLIIVISVMNGFDKNLKEKLLGFNYHIVAYLDSNSTDSISRISSLEDVENAVLFSQVQTILKKGKIMSAVYLNSIDFNEKEKRLWSKYLKEGSLGGLIIGRPLFRQLGINLGEEVEVFNPNTLKPLKLKVSGIFEVGLYDFDNHFIAIPMQESKMFLDKSSNTVWTIGIRIRKPENASVIRQKIRKINTEDINLIYTWFDYNKALFSAIQLEKIVMFIILSVIILVASFNIFSTQTIRVVEKIKDVGILKSIGINSRGIGLIFCLQGIFIGMAGVIVGLVSGLGICAILKKTNLVKLPSLITQIYNIDYLPVLVNYKDIVYICFTALIMSLLFSLFPALKASSIKEVQALKYE